MQNLRFVKRITTTLFALLMLWGIFFLSKLLIEQSENLNTEYVPQNAFFVSKIDGREIALNGINSLLSDENNEIIDLINQLIQRKSDDQTQQSTGILFHSDIVVFKELIGNIEITGVVFNLASPKQFEQNISSFLNDFQVASSKDNVGMVLTMNKGEDHSYTKDDLQMHAEKLCNKDKTMDLNQIFKPNEKKFIFETWSKSGVIAESDVVSSSTFSSSLKDGNIHFSGEVKLKSNAVHNMKRLQPKHSHFTSSIITEAVRDSINSFLKNLHLPEVNICGISLNYQGTEIVEEPTFCIVPRMDLLITSSKPYDVEKAIDSALCHMDDLAMVGQHLHYGGREFHYKQISANSFFIGVSANPVIVDFDKNNLIEFKGPAAPMTTFYGDGMMRKFLEIIPIYSASQKLSRKVSNIDVQVKRAGNKAARVSGEIQFKEDEDALKSLIHFAVEGQLIK